MMQNTTLQSARQVSVQNQPHQFQQQNWPWFNPNYRGGQGGYRGYRGGGNMEFFRWGRGQGPVYFPPWGPSPPSPPIRRMPSPTGSVRSKQGSDPRGGAQNTGETRRCYKYGNTSHIARDCSLHKQQGQVEPGSLHWTLGDLARKLEVYGVEGAHREVWAHVLLRALRWQNQYLRMKLVMKIRAVMDLDMIQIEILNKNMTRILTITWKETCILTWIWGPLMHTRWMCKVLGLSAHSWWSLEGITYHCGANYTSKLSKLVE